MARLVKTYPWKTTYILSRDDLEHGWVHENEEKYSIQVGDSIQT